MSYIPELITVEEEPPKVVSISDVARSILAKLNEAGPGKALHLHFDSKDDLEKIRTTLVWWRRSGKASDDLRARRYRYELWVWLDTLPEPGDALEMTGAFDFAQEVTPVEYEKMIGNPASRAVWHGWKRDSHALNLADKVLPWEIG